MFGTLFSNQTESFRQRPTRRQTLFLVFYGTGVLVRGICLFGEPPHMHHGPWFWLNWSGLALMFIGIAFNIREYLAGREDRRLQQANAASR